jgi:hypothetical protein
VSERAVAVAWIDSATLGDGGWMNRLDAISTASLAVRTVGFVVARTADAMVIAHSVDADRVCGVIAIPHSAVLSVRELSV